MEGSEKFKLKSEQMKFANFYRRNKGRTSPLGQVGIRERLRVQLRRSLAPKEVFKEMSRDKGYSGRCRLTPTWPTSPIASRSYDNNLPSLTSAASSQSQQAFEEGLAAQSLSDGPLLRAGGTSNVRASHAPPSAQAVAVLNATETPPNPLLLIILKQIEDLCNNPVGETSDVQDLITTLELQLATLR
ncbi:hypothetical protein KC19_VG091600 [Ceratodon purpureus]|uniref:Uncharacterized protein n=1 Tax=Ceratodon purpureus TaxID=3225 RepID=A0A8T0HNM4_CERPU|nr:hypothetical protein KC19_VG091600 [Ceratodon purpureus]